MNYEVITADIVTQTALHIGHGQGNEVTDALVRRDAQGRLLIPGTAIAGVLRTIATRLAPRLGHKPCRALLTETGKLSQACKCTVCKLFGDENPQERAEDGSASRVWVADAYLQSDTLPLTHIRDGVGIDRASRVAARQGAVKFDLEIVPSDAIFQLRLELEKLESGYEVVLAASLAEWYEGRGVIGGRTNRGLGAFVLKDVKRAKLDLDQPDNLFIFLDQDRPWHYAKEETNWLGDTLKTGQNSVKAWSETHPCLGNLTSSEESDDITGELIARSWLKVTLTLQATGPFLVNDPINQVQTGFDHAPLGTRPITASGMAASPKPILPGASFRGALRSQAERLARTLVTHQAGAQADSLTYFKAHCPACDPNARRKREVNSPGIALESCDSLLRAGGVTDDEEVQSEQLCLACRLFGSTRRGSRLRVSDGRFVGNAVAYKAQDFLAIDRFTGGGADRFKFDAIALWQPGFDTELFLENPTAWELGWLLLTLRDLQEGLIPLGFGAAKGYGRVEVKRWTVTFGFLSDDDVPGKLPAEVEPAKSYSGLYKTVTETWSPPAVPPQHWLALAQDWFETFTTTWQMFERGQAQNQLPYVEEDNYFGQLNLPGLYPLEVHVNGTP